MHYITVLHLDLLLLVTCVKVYRYSHNWAAIHGKFKVLLTTNDKNDIFDDISFISPSYLILWLVFILSYICALMKAVTLAILSI